MDEILKELTSKVEESIQQQIADNRSKIFANNIFKK